MRFTVCVKLFVSVIGLTLCFSSVQAGEVSGKYAKRLSPTDIAEIKAAIRNQRSVPKNVRRIEAVGPDKVVVQTGGKTGLDLATYYNFNVNKRSGKWIIDESSIEITSEPLENHGSDSDAIGR